MVMPVVAIVGRPNVGKSTLFNRIARERIAIVNDTPGVTRDRIYTHGRWLGHDFSLIDTGGIEFDDQPFITQIRSQVQIAIEEADVIIFLTDVRPGVTETDEKIAKILYHSKKPVVLATNKADNPEQRQEIYDFYALGFGEPLPVSSVQGTGIGDLLDAIVAKFPQQSQATDDQSIKFSFIGRPNVGKSSLVNALLGKERVIVSHVEGTTRDAIDTRFTDDSGQHYTMIDTAGIRKRGRVYENTEKYAVMRAQRAIDRSDVVLVVIDGAAGLREQDKKVAGYAHEAGRAVILLVNKWDLVEKDTHTMAEFREHLRNELQYLDYAPIIFVSALTKQRLTQLPDLIKTVAHNQKRRVQSSLLNDILLKATATAPAPSFKGQRLRVYYLTQVSVAPPTFVIFVNNPDLFHFSYQRFLINQLRESFDFTGTPIHLIARKRK